MMRGSSARHPRAVGRAAAALLLALLLPWAPGAHPAAADQAARRVVLISLDGAADWMLDRWLEQGKAPAFA